MAKNICLEPNDNGSYNINLGWFIRGIIGILLVFILTSTVGFPIIVKDVLAQEEEIKVIKKAQEIVERNQIVIDENVRNLTADSKWTHKKLNALLEAEGITIIERPDVEDSKLEKSDE